MRYPPNTSGPTGFVCGPPTYRYEGWWFEYGPAAVWPLKANGELRQRAGQRFYEMIDRFAALDKVEQEKYRIGGGCVAF